MSGTCNLANAMSVALTTGMVLTLLAMVCVSVEAEQLGRIVDHDAPPRRFVRSPFEHQVEEIGVVRHRVEVVGMGPIRTPQQAFGRVLDEGMHERKHIIERD